MVKKQSKITFFDFLYLFSFLLFAWFLGRFGGRNYGIGGWIGGAVFGLALTKLGFILIEKFVVIYHKHRPILPLCSNGKCQSSDYTPVKVTQKGIWYKCKCGDSYYKTGLTFAKKNNDGKSEIVWSKSNYWGKWEQKTTK